MKTNGTIKIESGIPIPAGRSAYQPLPDLTKMKVGDSFLVIDRKSSQVTPMTSAAGKRLKRRFTVRTTDKGVRVWRVE